MRFAIGLLASFAAVAIAADASSTSSSPAPTQSLDAETQQCMSKCDPNAEPATYSSCRCACLPAGSKCPGPSWDQAKDFLDCVADKCKNMDADSYKSCLSTCQNSIYFDPSSGTPQQTGGSGKDVSSGTSQPTATQSGSSSQTTSGNPSSTTTSKNAGVAVAGSSGAFLGALAALLAL